MSKMPATDKRTHRAALDQLSVLFTEKLSEGGSVTFSPRGNSMLPMLRAYGDSVTLIAPPARLKKGTVALFVLNKEDGAHKYILHRLVKIKDTGLIFCGDHRLECDPEVRQEDVVGVVTAYRSRGRERSIDRFTYKLYSFYMVHTVGFRKFALGVENIFYKIYKKLGGGSRGKKA